MGKDAEAPEPDTFDLPSNAKLIERVKKFKSTLTVTPERIRQIEETIDQDQSSLWYAVRRYRLTASMFGRIYQMRSSTVPDSFIKQLLISNQELSTPAVHWGKCKEPVALQRYIDLQLTSGHNGLVAVKAGFVISEDFPFLGATPDACVHDPSRTDQYGLVEIKCPYKYRDVLPEQAALQSDFCSYIMVKERKNILQLRRNHIYYSQVQGQMAITKRNWCDFVILYTQPKALLSKLSSLILSFGPMSCCQN